MATGYEVGMYRDVERARAAAERMAAAMETIARAVLQDDTPDPILYQTVYTDGSEEWVIVIDGVEYTLGEWEAVPE